MSEDLGPCGLDLLRQAVLRALSVLDPVPGPLFAGALGRHGPPSRHKGQRRALDLGLRAQASVTTGEHNDSAFAASSAEDEDEKARLIALVELARGGDKEAFGQLFDHYHGSVYRFLFYRLGSAPLAEDLTSDTFFRALRSMSSFRWQGKDFGAWLMTIARNLSTDHFKAGRTRLERTTEDMATLDATAASPEHEVLANLTNETLMEALQQLPGEQHDCLVMRFLQGLSIAETADALGRSAGAVKQLQLRGVRNLAKMLPEDLRPQG